MGPLEKAVRRLFVEVVNGGHLEVADELLAPTFRSHTPDGELDREAFRGYVTTWRNGFGDLRCEVAEVIESGDRIAWQVRAAGRHTGEFLGIAPTHRQVDFVSLNTARAVDGLIVAHTVLMDDAAMFAQLGALPQHKSALIRRGYKAFARGDIPAVLALLSPDIVWSSPDSIPTGGVFRGPDEVLRFFTGLGRSFAELAVEPTRFVEAGDDVVAIGTVKALTRTGNRVELPFVHVWRVTDGRAVSFGEYIDTATLARALSIPTQSRSDAPARAPVT